MDKETQQLKELLGKDRVKLNEPLWRYTSLHVGGPADFFFQAYDQKDLKKAVESAQKVKMSFFILGGGTNTLIGDKGFRGLVIKNETSHIKLAGMRGKRKSQTVYLEVDSGVGVNRLVRFTLDQGLSGLEAFLGQPGTVGGALYINAHNMHLAKFIGELVHGAKILTQDGHILEVPHAYFQFGYDQSYIQTSKDIVLSILFRLNALGSKEMLWETGQSVLAYRRKTQPQGVFSAGCTFRNISKSDAVRIATPGYTQSAGFILDNLGLKGVSSGNAHFSSHHANFITHRGGVKAGDMLKLINLAKQKAKEKYGVILEEEIVKIGEF